MDFLLIIYLLETSKFVVTNNWFQLSDLTVWNPVVTTIPF